MRLEELLVESAVQAAGPRPTWPDGWPPRSARVGLDTKLLERDLNVDLSGGEKKRNETVQLAVLEPEDRHPR